MAEPLEDGIEELSMDAITRIGIIAAIGACALAAARISRIEAELADMRQRIGRCEWEHVTPSE